MIVAGALIVREVLDRYGLDALRLQRARPARRGRARGRRAARAGRGRRPPGPTRAAESGWPLLAVAALAGCGGSAHSRRRRPARRCRPAAASTRSTDRHVFLAHPDLAPRPSSRSTPRTTATSAPSSRGAPPRSHTCGPGCRRRTRPADLPARLRAGHQPRSDHLQLTRFAPGLPRAAGSTGASPRAAERSTARMERSRPGQ